MAWESSTRRARLPKDWPKRVAQVKKRSNGLCEATRHVAECDGLGAEVDHRTQGDDHTMANLQHLSTPCHAAKTKAENAARNKLNAQLRRRPTEPHPGARQCPK